MAAKLLACTLIIIILLESSNKYIIASACFKSIISLGDSIADTGNTFDDHYLSSRSHSSSFPPYGETFFRRPTGRCSDGRLIIDFIAQEMGLPFVEPFYGGANNSKKFDQGVNFAVAGATALEDSFFKEKEITITVANASLAAQLSWFNGFLDKLYHNSSDRKRFFETSLVLMGEIGGNDYSNGLLAGKTVEMVQSFVPKVIQTISSAINELIKLGAVTLMVPGNFPFGCLPAYLTFFKSSNEEDYDPKTGCLNWPNSFSQYHNELLQLELNRIRKQNPNINIIYADYFNAAMRLYQSPEKYGFLEGGLRACCGGAGPYNVNFTVLCGDQGCSTCEDPSLYLSWDGVHMTEAAYRWIANGLLRGSFTNPRFDSICDLSSSKNAQGFSDH